MCNVTPDDTDIRTVACAQLLESLARVVLASTRCDRDQIERMISTVNNMAYDYENHGTYESNRT